jgi:putative ABC transport system permease protein
MLINYLKIAVRNLLRFKIYSFINIVGLAVSISACILIFLWVMDELSYDKFNKNADRIFRPYISIKINNSELNHAMTPAPLGEALYKDCPEVESFTRIWTFDKAPIVRYGVKVFNEKRFLYVDSSFFKVFTTEFVKGNPKTALIKPGTVVLTESTAHKYFGDENPMGKIINVDKNRNYVVTGVIKNIHNESHFHYDFLGSISTHANSRSSNWLEDGWYTYLLLRKGSSSSEFQKKLNIEVKKYLEPQFVAFSGKTLKQMEDNGNKFGFILEPLKSIHLYSHLDSEIEPNGEISYVFIFSAIAIAILLIACINFINLSTARSGRRAKEVGVRKALGSYKPQIAGQFLIESILTSSIAVILSIGIIEFILPLFNEIAGKNISFSLTENVFTLPLIISFDVVIGLFAGFYPAFYLSSFQPVRVLKSEIKEGSKKATLRSYLIIFQFAVSIMFIIGTFVIYKQLSYIRGKNLGFNKDQIVVIKNVWHIGDKVYSFNHELLKNPNVLSTSCESTIPGEQQFMNSYKLKGTSSVEFKDCRPIFSDYNFTNTYQIKMVKGRFFSYEHPSDSTAVVINESAARIFGIKDLDNKYLTNLSNIPNYKVIGIIKNFNFMSLHEAIWPLVIHPYKLHDYGNYLSIRIKPGNYIETLNFIEQSWKKCTGDNVLEYSFLDQNLEHLYSADQRTSKIASIFSVLAILVACLGLLGLAAFVTEQKTKEIGVRKVLGASISEILIMLSKEFTKWVLLANIIAWPAAYYFMNKWLQDFAYKVDISIWTFVITGLLTLAIALLTVSIHAIKAATANPVKSLRYE